MDIMKIQNKGISQLKEEALSLRFIGLFFGVIGLISLMISGYFFLIDKNTQSIIFIVLYFLTLLFLIVYSLLEELYINRIEIKYNQITLLPTLYGIDTKKLKNGKKNNKKNNN